MCVLAVSTITGIKPHSTIENNDPLSETGETITSVPRGNFKALRATKQAAVPVETARD